MKHRDGFTLIDVILGVAILTLAASGLIALLRQTMHSADQMHRRDREVRAAGSALASVAVHETPWLKQHLGESRYRVWTLRVERVSPALYHVAIADTATGATWVETTLYHAGAEDSSVTSH